MNADWKIIAGTLGIFAAGLVAGVVTFKLGEGGHRAPSPMMREFGGRPGPGPDRFDKFDKPGHGGERRWDGPDGPGARPPFLTPEFEKQVHDYHEKLKAVLDPYQDKIKAVLTADQQKKLDEARGEARERRKDKDQAAPRPPRDPGQEPEGGMRFVGMIIYKPVLERMSRDLALDAKQQAQLDAVFKDRREALLRFLDANPPPTIRMALGSGTPAPTSPR